MTYRSILYKIFAIIIIFVPPKILNAETYYVAVSYGNNNNDGKSLSAPFKTIAKAASVMSAGDICYIREGSYHEIVTMNNTDGASGSPIVFTNYNNERVIMDGTVAVDTSWSVHSGNIYKQKLNFRPWQLFVDRKEQVMARWPNAKFSDDSIWDNDNYWAKGTLDKDNNAYSNGTIIDDPYTNKDGTAIDLNAKGFDLDESGKEAIAILNVGSFKTWSRKVTSHSGNTFNYSNTPSWKTKHHYYYLEGRLEFLDSAGEWYFDITDSTLYFWAENNVHPKNLNIRGKVQSYAFKITASEYIHIKNLEFFATTVYFYNGDNCLIYGANFMYPSCSKRMLRVVDTLPEMTLFTSNSSNSIIRKSAFRNTDGTAVEMWGGDNRIDSTYFNNIDYSVADNSGLMITIRMNGSNNVFSHNTVHRTGASATVSAGIAPLVEYNNLYDTGHLQSDGSMVQITETEQDGAICRYNWLHDTEKYGARFDHSGTADGVNGLMHHNVAWNCLAGGIMAKGNNHKIYNNTVINSGSRNDIIILKVGDSDHSSTILKNNVAGKIANHRSNDVEIDFGTYSNNWNGYKESASITSVLTDTSQKDFSPKSGSAIIDAGAVISGITDGYQGSAPDMGAFESGNVNWTAGHGWDVNATFGSSWVELDEAYPTITSVSINSDNSQISVGFSEAVYNAIESPGNLEKEDFVLSISGGVATLSSSTPSSITQSGNVYTLAFSLSGTPNGSEVLKVVPVDNGIYDAVGNEASTTQSNNTKNLNDKLVPTITSVSLASDNSTLAVSMSEAVYKLNSGSGDLEVSDFALSISGGVATLSSSTPSSITKSGNVYTLGVSLSGTPNGSEVLKVVPVDNGIYDGAGNEASTTQSNNTKNLNDKLAPTITSVSLASDNTSLSVTISEAVYNTNGGSGNLEKEDFVLSISGGVATLSSSTPSSITQSGNVYTLAFSLSGTPNGSEVLKVVPVDNSIYDAVGNEASTTQSNNTKNLNDQTKPVIGSVVFADDNSYVDVKFSVGVFSNFNGSGALEASDFSLVFTKNDGTLTSASIISLKKNDSSTEPNASSLVGGESTIRIFINLSGTANGLETLSIAPKDSNSIFDSAGNPAAATQSNNSINFRDLVAPTVTFSPTNNSTDISLNSNITLIFSESIRKVDNSEINDSNVDSLIVLKDSDINGTAIQFVATIDSSNTVLKIDPTVDFTFSQKVFLSISGVEDNGDNTLSGLTSITFTTVTNVPPTAINQTVKLDEDGEVNITLSGNDNESSTLSYGYSSANFGALTGKAPNLVYKPISNFFGQDSFKFVVKDEVADSDSAIISIIVNPINDTPILELATYDTLLFDQNNLGVYLFPKEVQKSNTKKTLIISDVDDKVIEYTTISIDPFISGEDTLVYDNGKETNYTLSINGSKSSFKYSISDSIHKYSEFLSKIKYKNLSGYKLNQGKRSISITVSDGDSTSMPSVRMIDVKIVNSKPFATSFNDSTNEDESISIILKGTDKDPDTLAYKITQDVQNGLLNGVLPNLTYLPDENYFGYDSLKYIVSDGSTISDTATVLLTVFSVNDKPSDFPLKTPENDEQIIITNNNVDSSNVIFSWHNSTDPDKDKLYYIFNAEFEIFTVEDKKVTIDFDTTLFNDLIYIGYNDILGELDSVLGTNGVITWSVDVSDGIDTTINSEIRTLRVEGKYAALSINKNNVIPSEYALHQNYPNPFNPITRIEYDIPKQTFVKIEIYNLLGTKITTLLNEEMIAGRHAITWNAVDRNGRKIPSGIYFYHIRTNDFTKTNKMLLLK